MDSGNWFRFAGQDKNEASSLTTPSDSHLPSVECKIENAHQYASSRQNGCGDVGIDQLIHVMEQKPALVGLDASLGFKLIFEHPR